MVIEVTRDVRYRGGLKILRGTKFLTAILVNEDEAVPNGFSVPHPRFNDPKIRAFVPSTHAEVLPDWAPSSEQYRPGDLF